MILFDKFIDLGEEICENNSFIQNQMAVGVTFPKNEDVVTQGDKRLNCLELLFTTKKDKKVWNQDSGEPPLTIKLPLEIRTSSDGLNKIWFKLAIILLATRRWCHGACVRDLRFA